MVMKSERRQRVITLPPLAPATPGDRATLIPTVKLSNSPTVKLSNFSILFLKIPSCVASASQRPFFALIAYAQHGVRRTRENCASNYSNNSRTPPCLRSLYSPRFAEGHSESDNQSSLRPFFALLGITCTTQAGSPA